MWYVGKARFFLLFLFCAGIFGAPSLYADGGRNLAGEVVSTAGTVFVRPDVRDASWKPTPAKPGDKVYANDVINTSSNGSIKLLLKDKTIIDLGPSALFKVDKFEPGTGTDRQAELSMMYGTVRGAVTQKITGNGKFRLRTPTATMGVRGTEFVVATQAPSNMQAMSQAISGKSVAPAPPAPGAKGQPPAPNAAPVQTQITVLQGKVDVAKSDHALDGSLARGPASAGAISLSAGQQITASATAPMPTQTQVTTLSTTQLSSLAATATVQDNTFSKAVVLNINTTSAAGPSNGGSSSPSGGGAGAPPGAAPGSGLATLAELSSAVATNTVTAAPTVSLSQIGVPGTFGAANPAAPTPFVHTGTHTVTINIVHN